MIEYLKQRLNIDQVITFGSIPERYDVIVTDGNMNRVVKQLKKLYEPIGFRR